MFQYFIVALILMLSKYTSEQCTENLTPPKYILTEKCHKSTLSPVYKANFTSLASCFKLGLEKKGLSLNFSPPEAAGLANEGDGPVDYTCEILKCAESAGGISLVNDTRYDYYSIYAKDLPHVNSTCLAGIGMFYLIPFKQNYTLAVEICRNMSGNLADVINEKRTNALSHILEGVDRAFVGIQSDNGSDFRTSNGNKLDCITYRAWSPGHPRRNRLKYGCVAVTKSRTWLTLPCTAKLPAICELNSSGPYKKGSFFASTLKNITLENDRENRV